MSAIVLEELALPYENKLVGLHKEVTMTQTLAYSLGPWNREREIP